MESGDWEESGPVGIRWLRVLDAPRSVYLCIINVCRRKRSASLEYCARDTPETRYDLSGPTYILVGRLNDLEL